MDLNQSEFETKLLELLESLHSLVNASCINVLSNNHSFILTEIDIHSTRDADPLLRQVAVLKAKKNQKKLEFKEASLQLFSLYPDIYDLVVTVFRSIKRETIVEFSYLLKSSLDDNQQKVAKNVEPMFHTRVFYPLFWGDKTEKFDVNWEHQEWRNWWRRIVWKWKIYKSNGNPIN